MERGCVYTFSCIDLSIGIPLGSFFSFFLPLLNFHLPQLWFNLGLFSYIRRCGLVFFRLLGRVSEMWFAPLIIFWRLVYRLSRTTPTFPNCIFSPSFCLNNNKEFNLANVLFWWGFQFRFFFSLLPFVVLSSSTCFFSPLFPPFCFFISMGFSSISCCCCCCHFVWTLSDDLRVERERFYVSGKKKTVEIRRGIKSYRGTLYFILFCWFFYFSGCSDVRCVWSF